MLKPRCTHARRFLLLFPGVYGGGDFAATVQTSSMAADLDLYLFRPPCPVTYLTITTTTIPLQRETPQYAQTQRRNQQKGRPA